MPGGAKRRQKWVKLPGCLTFQTCISTSVLEGGGPRISPNLVYLPLTTIPSEQKCTVGAEKR